MAYQMRLKEAGLGSITTEIHPAPDFYFAEDYHQQYLHKNVNASCMSHGTGVGCPIERPEKARG
jgi:peptide-methionine (S)-S-oxide reductase